MPKSKPDPFDVAAIIGASVVAGASVLYRGRRRDVCPRCGRPIEKGDGSRLENGRRVHTRCPEEKPHE